MKDHHEYIKLASLPKQQEKSKIDFYGVITGYTQIKATTGKVLDPTVMFLLRVKRTSRFDVVWSSASFKVDLINS